MKQILSCLPDLPEHVRSRLIIDYGDYRNTVFLAGTGRSGTTWLQEFINWDNSFRVIFEPFHRAKTPLIQSWNAHQYLRPSNDEDRFLEPARQIVSGRLRGIWSDRYNKRLIARKRLLKDIRANLLLFWLKQHFPEIPVILLLRHPCAVAVSQLQLKWSTYVEDFLEQKALMQDFLGPFDRIIRDTHDRFEQHILQWCIENYVPLRQFQQGEILVLHYEHLCVNPGESMGRVASFLGSRISPRSDHTESRPSRLSRADSAIVTGEDTIRSWRKHVSERQVERAAQILSYFNLDDIYGVDDLPNANRQ